MMGSWRNQCQLKAQAEWIMFPGASLRCWSFATSLSSWNHVEIWLFPAIVPRPLQINWFLRRKKDVNFSTGFETSCRGKVRVRYFILWYTRVATTDVLKLLAILWRVFVFCLLVRSVCQFRHGAFKLIREGVPKADYTSYNFVVDFFLVAS